MPDPGAPIVLPVLAVRPASGDAAGAPPTVVLDGSGRPELDAALEGLTGLSILSAFATWNDAAADWGIAVLAVGLPDPATGQVDRVIAASVSVLELGADQLAPLAGAAELLVEVVRGAVHHGPFAVAVDPDPVRRALAGFASADGPLTAVRPVRVLDVGEAGGGTSAEPRRPLVRLDAAGAADVVRRIVEAGRSGARPLTVWQSVDDGRGVLLLVRVGDLPTGERPPVFLSATFRLGADAASLARLAAADAFIVELVDTVAAHRLTVGHDRFRLRDLLDGATS
ncbi:MAG TPA: hypothetical protein VK866_01350 [Acidimicrobiales bacterium]|nr:hypothetical protein [Acidimicrobiales bacterium]